ncbi:MAG: hypothetical protein IPI21_04045 [Propionivibrio sp.]|nr:hypothetical protein [Propionivibrio sp.]
MYPIEEGAKIPVSFAEPMIRLAIGKQLAGTSQVFEDFLDAGVVSLWKRRAILRW